MKQFQHTMLLASLATLLLLAAGCTREEIGNKEGSGGSTTTGQAVSVTLPVLLADPEPIAEGMTAPRTAPATRTLTSALTNVWVLQFDSSGKNVSTTNTGTLAAGAHLAPTLVSGKNCTLYVVANGAASGLSTSNPATLEDFETKLLYTTKVTDATQIPLAGKLADVEVVDIGGGTGQLKLMDATTEIVLKRILAEVTLTVDFDVPGFSIHDGVTLYNVPVGAAYGWDSNVAKFPDHNFVANFGYTSTAVPGLFAASTTTVGTKTTYKWFVGENRRGRNYQLVYPTERNTNVITSSTDYPISYATYARIEIGATNAAPPYTIKEMIYYEIYLGSGSVIDFNLERNHTYTLSTTIKGSATYQELLIDTDGRVSGINLPICLTDKRADSPFAIMQKEWESEERWTNKGSSVTGATDPFDGKKNTDKLSPVPHSAALECRANGEEWDLPALAELALIWIYLPAIPEADRPAWTLWSSTESDSGNSWSVDYTSGKIWPYEKNEKLGHRCIKSR